MKKAFITGITGQDGSYLAEYLLEKGYEVHGLIRRSSSVNIDRIKHIHQDIHTKNTKNFLHYGDLGDSSSLNKLLYRIKPDEIYHLAAQSHVRISFDIPEYTGDVTALGTTRILEAIRETNLKTKFYNAASSELYGDVQETPQNENTPFNPRSPYACAKQYSFFMTRNYRDGYNIFACNGILFNHESPRRGENFVTRKITLAVANIKHGLQAKLYLGNLDAKRDWGYARDYVKAMWLMMQQDEPGDYVIATGQSHSVREFLELAFDHVGLDWKKYVEIDPYYFRPTEVDVLVGNPSKAQQKLGWEPGVSFEELIRMMVDADMKRVAEKINVTVCK